MYDHGESHVRKGLGIDVSPGIVMGELIESYGENGRTWDPSAKITYASQEEKELLDCTRHLNLSDTVYTLEG